MRFVYSELFEERFESASAMAERELGFEVDFGHGAVEFRQIKEWVVSEAACSAGSAEDSSFDCAFGGVENLAVAGGGKDATIARGALCRWNVVELLQEQNVVPDIRVVER